MLRNTTNDALFTTILYILFSLTGARTNIQGVKKREIFQR